MKIKVNCDDHPIRLTGGEYATCEVEIFVNKNLSEWEQTELVIHAVLENLMPLLPHDMLDRLVDATMDGLGQLTFWSVFEGNNIKSQVLPLSG